MKNTILHIFTSYEKYVENKNSYLDNYDNFDIIVKGNISNYKINNYILLLKSGDIWLITYFIAAIILSLFNI